MPENSQSKLPLEFDYEEGYAEENITARAGIPLVVETFRVLGLAESVKANLLIKQRQRGLDEAAYGESFIILNAAGGDCLEDFEPLREDRALAKLIGHELPSPEAARKFLYRFPDESKVEEAQRQLGEGQSRSIPAESPELRCLGHVHERSWGDAAPGNGSPPSTWTARLSRVGSRRRSRPIKAAAWQAYREDTEVISECAEPPVEGSARLRHIAIRMRKRQGELFADGSEARYFAVVTNLGEWKPRRLLEWHREKAGSIEAVHDVLKHELASGVLPCGRFGANAAWLRLAGISHNVLTALKRIA